MQKMQILRKTNLEGYKRALQIGGKGVIDLLKKKALTGRGGAGFSTADKWMLAFDVPSDEKYVICNADEGEPGTFKDKLIMTKNPKTLIEGIIVAAYAIGAKKAFIYLRGEYEYLHGSITQALDDVVKRSCADIKIDIIVGAGAYVCGDETAIIRSIEGERGHPYYKPPYPPIKGLFGKPTVVNNVETLTNVPQAILYDDWRNDLRLISLSGNVTNPGVYELPYGTNLIDLIKLGKPKKRIKAIYSGCFGGCFPYQSVKLTYDRLSGLHSAIGAFSIIVIDEDQSILDVAISIANFYCHESCGKCTPCREGTKRILDLLLKVKSGKASLEDLDTLRDLAEHIHETSLCGLGQSATVHVLNALEYFWYEFEDNIKGKRWK